MTHTHSRPSTAISHSGGAPRRARILAVGAVLRHPDVSLIPHLAGGI